MIVDELAAPEAPQSRGPHDALDLVETHGRGLNTLIAGDATQSLRAIRSDEGLREAYVGRVRLCYLDPPFNTGESYHHYSDSLSNRAWQTTIEDCVAEVRHILAPDGSVWFHIDDARQHVARQILDDAMGPGAFVATIVWQKRTSRDNRTAFSSMHEYIHVYAPVGPVAWRLKRNGLADTGTFHNPDNDPRGPWRSAPLSAQAGHGTAQQFYVVRSPKGAEHAPPPGRCWTYSADRLAQLDAEGRVYWPREGHGRPRLKRYASEASGLAPHSLWMASEVGSNTSAKKSLMADFPDVPAFDTPKPVGLLERIIHIGSDPGEIVMDPFLGSGTTAVAASSLGRRWVGIEREEGTLRTFAVPRLTRLRGDHHDDGFRYLAVSNPPLA